MLTGFSRGSGAEGLITAGRAQQKHEDSSGHGRDHDEQSVAIPARGTRCSWFLFHGRFERRSYAMYLLLLL
jgi:hypothetical protein